LFPSGTIFPFVVLITIAVSGIVTIIIGLRGRVFNLRRLSAVEALYPAVGRAVEMGGAVHWCMGTGRGRSIQDIAGQSAVSFLVLQRLARHCAKLGARLLPSLGQPEAVPLVDAICSQAFLAENVPQNWKSEDIGFFPESSYEVSIPLRLQNENVKSNVMIGEFVSEAVIIAESGVMAGAFQIGGTTAWNNIAYFVTTCDEFLIGEEIYAAGAYLSENPIEKSSLIGQDVAKFAMVLLMLIGVATVALGSQALVNLLKM